MFQPSVAFVSLLLFGVAASSSLFFEPKSSSVVCPDGERCPDQQTCCKDSSGQRYGCCPMPDATCCDDGLHCCPHLYKCDLEHQTCVQQSSGNAIPFDLIKYTNADSSDDDDSVEEEVKVEKHDDSLDAITGNVKTVCPDSSQCPEGNTCCLLGSGQYGCCPYKEAVCCPDKAHCCPNGYECNMEKQTCSRGSLSIPWSSQPVGDGSSDVSDASDASEPNTVCKDGLRCEGEQTCCELPHGGYACCMYDRGVCCADKLHCCRPGTRCNEAAQRCDHATFSLPWDNLREFRSVPWSTPRPAQIPDNAELRVGDVCPDETKCADGSTCCEMGSGRYGCCNFPNAVCCADKAHCCPNGFTCDVAHSRCVRGTIMVPWTVSRVRDVECPDGSECVGEEETCCELQDGTYGCCPYQDAVCCSDKLHCCPSGMTCDLAQGRCVNRFLSLPWSVPVSKKPSPDASDITCPDGSTCPSGDTCCLISDTGYGCCPHPDAVCCSDRAHCCPHGFTCNLVEMKCDKGTVSLPWSTTTRNTQTVTDDPCRGEEICPSDSTCCVNTAGGASCCPLTHAVCCEDKVHCCPEGYRCDLKKKSCERDGAESLSWAASPPPPTAAVRNVVCPGGAQSCPDGSTCCLTPSGDYACCPLPEAVCCDDKVHCCPNGYTCNVAAGTCTRSGVALPWSDKLAAQSTAAPQEAPEKPDIECPVGHTSCRSENAVDATCCPFENAVCCGDDGQHCCPAESSCDSVSRMCKSTTSSLAISWQPTKRRSAVFQQLMDRLDALDDLDPL